MSAIEAWRLIESGARPGDFNMALDVALALGTKQNATKPVLRLFRWAPAAISLGFHQSAKEINLELCQKEGLDVVIRPTGGRAILHDQELTYSVVLPESSHYYHKDILPVYHLLSRCLVAGLQQLGVPVAFERAGKTARDFSRGELSSLCYAASIQHEIGIMGRKLVGSAQRRYAHAALQHGSILIGKRHIDLPLYLSRGEHKRRLSMKNHMEKNTVCLNELDQRITADRLANAIKDGFAKELNILLVPESPAEQELELAEQLRDKHTVLRNL